MKKPLLLSLFALIATLSHAQNWELVSQKQAYPRAKKENKVKRNQKIFKLDRKTLDEKLVNVSSRGKNNKGTIINMPNVNGNLERFEIWEASNFSEIGQKKFPNIRSYTGKSLADPYSTIRFSTGPSGISATTFRGNSSSEYLETFSTDGKYFEIHQNGASKYPNQKTEIEPNDVTKTKRADLSTNNNEITTLRLALSVTGEYSQYFGGTKEKALEAMNNTLTRVNGIFEKDLAINLNFIDNIEELIYLDPETDPYSVYVDGISPSISHNLVNNWMVELQTNLRDSIGENNYDLGHLIGYNVDDRTTSYRSNPNCIGCVCDSSFPKGKGSGTSSRFLGDPEGEDFDYEVVAHEIAHQLGANHTYSHLPEGANNVQVEPGSGSTIMATSSTFGEFLVQKQLDNYFANVNIQQIKNNINSKSCGIKSRIKNTPPTIELGKTTYHIPLSTAFKLDAKIHDNENDAVLVNWEQINSDSSNEGDYDSRVGSQKVLGPNFRSVKPTKETYRYFPGLNHILNDNLFDIQDPAISPWEWVSTWESLTEVPREYDFAITARDNNPNGALNSYENVKVIVTPNTAPFRVHTPNIDQKLRLNEQNFNVIWSVANTNSAPIETSHVKVSISWDGGSSFDELGIVENTGTASFTIPRNAKTTDNGYIMIEAVDNIFLAVKRFATEGTLSTKDIDIQKLNIYPNPTNGDFTVDLKAIGNIKIDITDLTGRTVYTETDYANGDYKKSIRTKLSSGTYIIKISSNEGTTTSKIMIR